MFICLKQQCCEIRAKGRLKEDLNLNNKVYGDIPNYTNKIRQAYVLRRGQACV